MSSGLIALLDDVAALAKAAAAGLDDIAGQAAKAGTKAAGVVIDDAAVTPRYVAGLAPSRELPIVGAIALGSLRNKLLYLLPAALVLGTLAPWAITPLLMLGGAYLCLEGAEKVVEAVRPHAGPHGADAELGTSEEARVAGAIRTDLILSAEIMAVTLGAVPGAGFLGQAVVLGGVGLGVTLGVYGAVALIVKADDAGLVLVRTGRPAWRWLGLGLVRGMVPFLRLLAVVGTAAMLWVGGGILLHGLETMGVAGPAHAVAAIGTTVSGAVPVLPTAAAWLVESVLAAMAGLVVGIALAWTTMALRRPVAVLLGR